MGEWDRGEHRKSSGFFSPVSRPGSSILEGGEGGGYHVGCAVACPPEQGLDCCVCCPLRILGPSQAGHGVRPHSRQGQGTLLSHCVSFTPYTCVYRMRVCVWERGPAALGRLGPYLCVCVAACLGLRGRVCTCVGAWARPRVLHMCTVFGHACALVWVHPERRIQLQVEDPR